MMKRFFCLGVMLLFVCSPSMLPGADGHSHDVLPSADEVWRVLSLRDYNTRVVVFGTMLLGIASGLVGTFLMLRKRALLADAVSHATLPGISIAFIFLVMQGAVGKSFVWLLIGAGITGTIGMLGVMAISATTRLKDDAALGIVLSVFFGIGISFLSVASRLEQGSAAGLSSFIYGKPASMLMSDAILIAGVALAAAIACGALFKEFSLLCFDPDFAATQGWPVLVLDLFMMSLVVVTTVIGLQSVGLILVVALLIIPAAAARFWSDNLRAVLLLSGVFGGISGLFGSAISALAQNLPAGAIIVLVAAFCFVLSLFFGKSRGLVRVYLRHRLLVRKIMRQHLLRGIYELGEEESSTDAAQPLDAVLARRSWSRAALRRTIRRAVREGLVRSDGRQLSLTDKGIEQAMRVLRNHRLWEMYLISHADIAPSHVDRDADQIEHVLDSEMIKRLELMMASEYDAIPASPH